MGLLLMACSGIRASFKRQVVIVPTIDPASVSAEVNTVAGPTKGTYRDGFEDGKPEMARFRKPMGVASFSGGVVLADAGNHAIRTVDNDGVVSTIAGGPLAGFVDGPTAVAQFFNPHAVAVGPREEIYVADTSNHAVRRIFQGVVTTLFSGGANVKSAIAEPRVSAATHPNRAPVVGARRD